MKEMYRSEWNPGDERDDHCPNCQRGLALFFNGGELDQTTCDCGWFHRIEHVRIDLVSYKPDEPK